MLKMSDSFDLRMSDIFSIQDTVAQQVASRLRLLRRVHSQAVGRALKRPFEHRIDPQLFRCSERIGVLIEISADSTRRTHNELARLTDSANRCVRDSQP